MKRALVPLVLGLLVTCGSSSRAQGYHARIDAQGQSIWFRGLTQDSIPVSQVVTTSTGGTETPDGHAVRCGAGSYCFFYRPGPQLHGIPLSTTASLTIWGLGIEGLSVRGTGRLLRDVGPDEVWPAADPSLQLIEGLLEYRRSNLTVRAGRQLVFSRLEPIGFDGGWGRYRINGLSLELTGYGGWGLDQATAIPVTSPALNPLDEWRPRKRQLVAGAEAAWLWKTIDVRGEYRREIDPEDHYFVSERTAFSFGAVSRSLRLNSGFDYNIAEGHFGSADATATYLNRRFSLSAGARRYRPYFSLWTLWGAFSPVPYTAFNVAAQAKPLQWLSVNGRAERYEYDDAEVSTALVPGLVDHGWRARIGATANLNSRIIVDANYGAEHGPGASSRSADATLTLIPFEQLSLDFYGGSLARPLELRFYDATSRWIGGRAQWQPSAERRLWADAAFVGDDRERPDTGDSSLDQLRVRAGISLAFGSGADRTALPPAKPQMR